MKSFIILKKLYILILFSLFSNLYANKTYITMGVDIDLSVNCNENVIEKIGKVLPKPGIYLGFNSFKEESNIGFHFDGNIFVKTIKGEWLLDKINPVEVEICSDIVDDTMDVYMTNCRDGLLIDFEKHGIMNSLDHPTVPDIFLYTLSMKEA